MQLFIHSFGAKLAVRDGIFEITTIEGKQYVKHDYAPTELESIWIQRGCNFTSAAVELAKGSHLHKRVLFSANVLKYFKLHLQGQLSFVRYIRGKMDVAYVRLSNRMKVYAMAV